MPRPIYPDDFSPRFALSKLRYLAALAAASRQGIKHSALSKEIWKGGEVFKNQIDAIEDDADILILQRAIRKTADGTERPLRYHHPERLEQDKAILGVVEGNGDVLVKSDLTLDGEIWAEFATTVLTLYELTRQATTRLEHVSGPRLPVRQLVPKKHVSTAMAAEPEVELAPIDEEQSKLTIKQREATAARAHKEAAEAAFRELQERETEPHTRHSAFSRGAYLTWMRHQTHLMQGHWDLAQETSVFDLVRQVPGVEEPEYVESSLLEQVLDRQRELAREEALRDEPEPWPSTPKPAFGTFPKKPE